MKTTIFCFGCFVLATVACRQPPTSGAAEPIVEPTNEPASTTEEKGLAKPTEETVDSKVSRDSKLAFEAFKALKKKRGTWNSPVRGEFELRFPESEQWFARLDEPDPDCSSWIQRFYEIEKRTAVEEKEWIGFSGEGGTILLEIAGGFTAWWIGDGATCARPFRGVDFLTTSHFVEKIEEGGKRIIGEELNGYPDGPREKKITGDWFSYPGEESIRIGDHYLTLETETGKVIKKNEVKEEPRHTQNEARVLKKGDETFLYWILDTIYGDKESSADPHWVEELWHVSGTPPKFERIGEVRPGVVAVGDGFFLETKCTGSDWSDEGGSDRCSTLKHSIKPPECPSDCVYHNSMDRSCTFRWFSDSRTFIAAKGRDAIVHYESATNCGNL